MGCISEWKGPRIRVALRESSAQSSIVETGRTIMQKTNSVIRSFRLGVGCAAALYIGFLTPARAGPEAAKELAKQLGVIFAHELADAPGKNLVVVKLDFPPKSLQQSKEAQQYLGHRHPGSTYVYVLKGTMRLGLAGQPVQLVHAGESFFEPVGAIHTIAESASATEPASAIAVLIIPDGAPILTEVEGPKK
jgi:quercetin dioxygenase-like cupin family protein